MVFPFELGRELGFRGEIWQRGFSDVRITDQQSFLNHRNYIRQNPVRAGLAEFPEEYPYGSAHLRKLKRAGAEAQSQLAEDGTTEVVP